MLKKFMYDDDVQHTHSMPFEPGELKVNSETIKDKSIMREGTR